MSEDVDALREKGVLVWPNFFSSELIDSLVQELEAREPRAKIEAGEDLIWRIYKVNEVCPQFERIFEDKKLFATVKTYLGGAARISRKALANKNVFIRQKDGPTEFFHFDDWQHRFKVMVYLDDVNDDNSPFSYMEGSHRFNLWKLWQDYLFYRDFDRSQPKGGGNINWAACFFDHQLEFWRKKYGWRRNTIKGQKGTVILFDSRGLHRGQPLVKGTRRVLQIHFRLTDTDGEAKVWKNRSDADLV